MLNFELKIMLSVTSTTAILHMVKVTDSISREDIVHRNSLIVQSWKVWSYVFVLWRCQCCYTNVEMKQRFSTYPPDYALVASGNRLLFQTLKNYAWI